MPKTPPRPTSSRPRPQNRDDVTQATSSLVPHPYGDEVALTRPRDPHNNPLSSSSTGRGPGRGRGPLGSGFVGADLRDGVR